MKVFLLQTVLSPYRKPLFQRLGEAPGIQFALVLLSDRFLVRPQWKCDVHSMPFRVIVPWGFSRQIGEEKEFIVNPFLLFTFLRERPDVIVCGGFNIGTIMAWLYAKITGAKYVIWTEATLHTDGKSSNLRLRLRRLLAAHASAFIEAGTLAREYVHHLRPALPPSHLFRAFNCIDTTRFQDASGYDPAAFEARGLPPKNLLFVGKLIERKGIPALLATYRRVLASTPSRVGLLLIGEGPLGDDVRKTRDAEGWKDLYMEGWVKNESTPDYYRFCDVFVLLSDVDHNPLVLLEALAVGIPVVCSQGACSAVDFIEPGVNGYIVDPHQTEVVAERIKEVLAWDAPRRERCREAAKRLAHPANYHDAAEAFLAAARLATAKP